MIKILIVDDNKSRIEKLKSSLTELITKNMIRIDEKYTSDAAKIALKLNQYDYLILDVFLPKKDNYSPDERNGLGLLKQINSDSKFYSPKKIVGITAYLNDISRYESEFREYASIIFEARRNDTGWLESLKKIIEKDVESQVSYNLNEKDSVLVTVHGIRTYAPWQNTIEEQITNISNKFNHIKFNYGFLNILCFLFPPTRYLFARKIIQDIRITVESNKNKRIYIICHSFGTYLVYCALSKLTHTDAKIECLIFSGSVLKRTTSLKKLKQHCNAIINDCAVSDYILLLCKMLVIGLGDAGRKGFIEPNDGVFINRYFKGGHSTYFEDKDFIEINWLPLIFDNKNIASRDERRNHIFSDVTNALQNIIEYLKIPMWLFFSFLLIALVL
ncbi:alpha/beta hydrolase [Klebsiella quasipneumoniae]|uniref:alpha/beta hydrolase n=1 Tax=Klebsiella quasipneumoniae TaxID=1463165 RepID=UPI001034854D|nr:alpha/beta hydrolase [Klebsiella quasipneumoniae]